MIQVVVNAMLLRISFAIWLFMVNSFISIAALVFQGCRI